MARALFAVVAVALGFVFFPPAHAVVPPLKQPAWVELNAEQKEILAPLAREWDQFEHSRRKKWLGIAERYPAMKSEEQSRVQRRMVEWVRLSPEERKLAREKYKNLSKAPPEHKESIMQKWQEYKDLPEEQKQRLQAEAAAAKAAKPKGASKGLAPATGAQKPAALPLPALAPLQPPPPAQPQVPPAPVAPAPAAQPAPAAPPPIVLPPSGQ
jgi:hypothetical protein